MKLILMIVALVAMYYVASLFWETALVALNHFFG